MGKPRKQKPKKAIGKGVDIPIGPSLHVATLLNRVDGLQELLGNAMAQIQQLKQQMNENWTKFVFHNHRRIDTSGPQFYDKEFEMAWIQEQERQKAAKAPPTPPKQAPPAEKPAQREKK
jgi:hypothetical protein